MDDVRHSIHEILAEIEQAYPLDIFPDTTQAERDEVIASHRGFIDRTSAMMGRHLVKVIRDRLASGRTPRARDEGGCDDIEHDILLEFDCTYCDRCGVRLRP